MLSDLKSIWRGLMRWIEYRECKLRSEWWRLLWVLGLNKTQYFCFRDAIAKAQNISQFDPSLAFIPPSVSIEEIQIICDYFSYRLHKGDLTYEIVGESPFILIMMIKCWGEGDWFGHADCFNLKFGPLPSRCEVVGGIEIKPGTFTNVKKRRVIDRI